MAKQKHKIEYTKPNAKPQTKESEKTEIIRETESQLPLTRLNFILMAIAGAVIIIGFLLMTGEPSTVEAFNPDIFSARRIVVGPTIAFLGFIFMGFAIMWRSKEKSTENQGEE